MDYNIHTLYLELKMYDSKLTLPHTPSCPTRTLLNSGASANLNFFYSFCWITRVITCTLQVSCYSVWDCMFMHFVGIWS